MFGRGPRPPPPPLQDDDDLPPPDFDDEPPDDEFDEDIPPPPDLDDDDGPADDDFESASGPPDDFNEDEPPMDDDDDDYGPPPSLPGSSPPESIPGSTRSSLAPPSPTSSDDDDIPPPPSGSPPPRPGAIRLPVKPPTVPYNELLSKRVEPIQRQSVMGSNPTSKNDLTVDAINQGLNLLNIPTGAVPRRSLTSSLFNNDNNSNNDNSNDSKNDKTINPNNSNAAGNGNTSSGDNSFGSRASTLAQGTDRRSSTTRGSLEGYFEVQGKFEGDPFETMHIKPTKTNLYIKCSTGEEAVFDLLHKSYVFEDLDDSNCFVLDHAGSVILFKVKSRDSITAILAAMPSQVFEAPSERDLLPEETSDSRSRSYAFPDDESNSKHIKGTSVEEILQGSNNIPMNRAELDRIFSPRARKATIYGIGRSKKSRQRRKELIDSHIKKPIYSIRRVKQLCQWINSLHIWSTPIDIMNLHKQFCNGLLLAKLMKFFIPTVEYLHMNERALAEKPAVENIEKVLGSIWRSKSVNNSRVPKAIDIYEGNITKLVILLQELFDVYVRKPLYGRVIKMFKWYTSILRQYDMPLPIELFSEGDLSDVWPHFQSGTAMFCIIYHFIGPVTIGSGVTSITIDPLRITSDPHSISEFRANLNYVFNLLRALNIEVFWEADNWITHPDTEFIMLQLGNIYEAFKDKQCSLPPAQGTVAGVTSGPNGEPRVVGLIFADTLLSNRVSVERMARTVLLGTGEDALPLLPIDNSGLIDFKFYSPICPQGLLSFMSTSVKIMHATVALKEPADNSRDWNPSSHPSKTKEKVTEESLLGVLRSHNKILSEKDMMSTLSTHDLDKTLGLTILSTPLNATMTSATGLSGSAGTILRQSSSPLLLSSSSSLSNQGMIGLSIHDIHSDDELVASLDKQYQDMLQTLENDMKQSKQDTELQEDDLAGRYAELEAIADRISETDYERIFNQLESERKMLESESYRLKEHYKLRLTSIKVQRQETYQRLKAQLQEITKPSKSTHISSTKSVTSSIIKPMKSKPVNKELAEKGWLSINAKKNTHNIHLHRLQTQSITQTQTLWTPHKYRNKQQDVLETKSKTQSTIIENTEVEEIRNVFVDVTNPSYHSNLAAFNRFREKLHIRTEKWFESRNMSDVLKPTETMKDYQNSPPKIRKTTLIAVPPKEIDSDKDHRGYRLSGDNESDEKKDAYEYMSKAIREEELQRMQYEDDRRTKYLNQLPSFSRRKSTVG